MELSSVLYPQVSLFYCSSLNKVCLANFNKCSGQNFSLTVEKSASCIDCSVDGQTVSWFPTFVQVGPRSEGPSSGMFCGSHIECQPPGVPSLRTSEYPVSSLNSRSMGGLNDSWIHVCEHSCLCYYSLNICSFSFIQFHRFNWALVIHVATYKHYFIHIPIIQLQWL